MQTGQNVPGVTWKNLVDEATPYETGFKDKKWAVSLVFLSKCLLVHSREYHA
jgi:hypothetical protein